jgi:hypothetical protein
MRLRWGLKRMVGSFRLIGNELKEMNSSRFDSVSGLLWERDYSGLKFIPTFFY